ncbi:MAG: hypothetical protein HXY35_11505 [Chloroflexi bacterium]|nr:hypothetical protein [Chloroflexota bacterium]
MKRMVSLRTILVILFTIGTLYASHPASAAATIAVTTTTDSLAEDGLCSLREAVISANTDTATGNCPAGNGADVIVFDASLPDPAVFSLTLTGANEDSAATGDLDLTGALHIQGAGTERIVIDGNGTDRVFDIRPGATVTISGVTVRNGNPGSGANGGGVIVTGGTPRAKLTLLNSVVTGNTAVIGGGIQNAGNGATAVIQDTQVVSNSAVTSGGGIANSGDLTILNSTLAQNQARSGGGIEHSGFSLKLTNVTVSGNSVSDNGGGLYNRGDAILLNVTFHGNTASGPDTGGNLFNDNASLAVKNSILAASNADGNCFNNEGTMVSQGNNLESGDTCGFHAGGDLINTDPMLGPLQDNGGFTLTHALLAGSPAIDAGTNNGCPSTDQRGVSRPVDGELDGTLTCDIGAYEFDAVTNTPTASPTAHPTDSPTPTLTALAPTATHTPTSTPITPTPTPPTTPCAGAVLPLVFLLLFVYQSGLAKK